MSEEDAEAAGPAKSAMAGNVDFVRSIYAAWERGDFSSAAWAHPDIAFVVNDGPQPGSWSGLAQMAESYRDFLRTWKEGYRVEAEEYRELDDERVLVITRAIGRGKASGLGLAGMPQEGGANVFHIRNGKVTRLVLNFERERALA